MAAGGPRLVRPDERPASAPAAGAARERRLLPLALAALLIVLAYGIHQARRAAALEGRVGELAASLRVARAEVAAHRRHLEAIRGGVADVRQRLDALQALAAEPPPLAEPAPAP
jgi:hypothetical protein